MLEWLAWRRKGSQKPQMPTGLELKVSRVVVVVGMNCAIAFYLAVLTFGIVRFHFILP